MKILFVGLGSIGQRHLRNIRRLYGDTVEILAYRVRRLSQTFSDDMKIREGVNLEQEYNIHVFSDYAEAIATKPNVVFITNITAKHIECAIEAAKAGCDIFMEKPLSDSIEGVQELVDIVKENKSILYMGYQNRFHPCIQYAKKVLEEGQLGRILSADNEFSERLTTMHTYEDYRQTYMARKDMGGGPILNLQIHSLDYLQWLLGTPVSVLTIIPQSSDLEIDVEASASSIYEFQTASGGTIPVYSHTDFFQFPPVHILKIVGEKGRLEADLNKAVCRLYIEGDLREEKTFDGFVRNEMFITELKEMMWHVADRTQPEANLTQGIIGLKMALAAKESAKKHIQLNLEDIK